jgi:DNA mismatch endonuclease (patch repair protein)
MADSLTSEQRSACMRAVKSTDTSPELQVRRMVHSMGYRYALHSQKLPGKPDLVFTSRRKVIFVHGCFWHVHSCARGSRKPVTNAAYWNSKREKNKNRDKRHAQDLRNDNWKVLVVWECWTGNAEELRHRLNTFLQT